MKNQIFLRNPSLQAWSVALFLGLSCANVALAQETPPVRSREWTYTKKVLPTFEISCVASTVKKVNEQDWTFSIIADPFKKRPPMFVVSTLDATVNSQLSLQTDTSSKQFLHLRDTSLDAVLSAPSYWFAPALLPEMYKQIRRDSSMKVNYVDASGKAQKFNFSLSGSMATLETLIKNCDNKKDVFFLDFFEYLDKQAIPAEAATETGVPALHARLKAAWDTFFVTGAISESIQVIDDKMKPLLDQEKDYLKRTGRLNDNILAKQKIKTDAQAKHAEFTRNRSGWLSQLADTERALVPALADLKAKEDIYRPAAQEASAYFTAVDRAEDAVNSIESRISRLQSGINSASNSYNSYQRELQSLESQEAQLNRELSSAESDLSRAQVNLNSFNYDFEVRRAISEDSRHRSLQDDIRRYESQIRDYSTQVRVLEGRVSQLEGELNTCRRDTARDCSSIDSSASTARSNLSSARSNLSSAESSLRSKENDLDRRRTELESEVNDRRNVLVRAVNSANDRVSTISGNLRNVNSRTNTVRNEMSDLSDYIGRARSEISSLNSQLRSAQSDLDSRRQQLETVLARNGYRAKKAAYEQANNVVTNLRSQAANLDRGIRDADVQLAKYAALITKTQGELDVLLADLARQTTELDAVEALLEPMRVEKAGLTAQLKQAQEMLQKLLAGYKAILRDTIKTGTLNLDLNALSRQKFHDWLR